MLTLEVKAESVAEMVKKIKTVLEKLEDKSVVEKLDQAEAAVDEVEMVKPVVKKNAAKTKAPVDEDETFSLGDDDADAETPNPTIKDVIAACRNDKANAVKILKKLKVKSVHELKPAQYAKMLSELGV